MLKGQSSAHCELLGTCLDSLSFFKNQSLLETPLGPSGTRLELDFYSKRGQLAALCDQSALWFHKKTTSSSDHGKNKYEAVANHAGCTPLRPGMNPSTHLLLVLTGYFT